MAKAKQAFTLDPKLTLHLKLGLVWRGALEKLIKIEGQFGKLGRNRTGQNVLAYADVSIGVVVEAVRGSLRLITNDPTMAAAHDKAEGILFHTNMPTPLHLLDMEIREIWHGHKSPLFSQGYTDVARSNFLRRQIQAFAAASIQVLSECRISQTKAAELLAERLNEGEFPNPNKVPYSAETLLSWMKHRKTRQARTQEGKQEGKQEVTKLGDFEEDFQRYRVYLRGIAFPLVGRRNFKGARQAILTRFATFLDHSVIYSDKTR